MVSATNNYGFRGDIPSDTNRWNLYMGGTAQNYLAGRLGIGVTVPATALDVVGTATVRAAATQDGVALTGRAGGTSSWEVTLTPTTLSADQTLTLPNASGTVALLGTIALGTDTTGNYMSGISGTSPVSVAHTAGEGSSATVSLAASYGDTQNPYASKTANYVLAAPNGSAGVPTFRAIVAADIPTLNQNTTGTASNITASSNTTLTSLANLTTVGTLSALRVDGNFGIGGAGFAQIGLRFVKDIGGSAFSQGIFLGGAVQPTVTTRADMIWTAPTVAASVTVPTVNQFYATLSGVGTGSTITASAGFTAESNLGNNDLGTITNAYGFVGNLNTLAGFTRYNLFMNGSAPNYLNGRLGVGAALTSGAMAIVANTTAADKAFIVRGAASQSGDFLDVQNSGGTSLVTVNSSGNFGIGTTSLTGISFRVGKTITGAINSYASIFQGTVQADVTSQAYGVYASLSTTGTPVTAPTLTLFAATQGTLAGTVTSGTQRAYFADSNLIGATNNYAFQGAIPSGSGRWNLYMNGTAQNYLAGNLGIGTATPSTALDVVGTITATSYDGALASTTTATTQTVGDNSTKVATTAFVIANAGSMSQIDTQTFSSSTTYTIPATSKLIVVECIGAGGGGGSGRRGGPQAGGGGGGGAWERLSIPVSELGGAGASVTVTIGAGGAGAPRATVDGNGSAGSKGGNSRFGTFYFSGAMAGSGGASSGAGERGQGYTGGLAMTVGSEFGTGGRALLTARKGWRGGGGGGAGAVQGASSESDPPLTTTGSFYAATTGGGGAAGTGDGGNGTAGGASQGGGGGANGASNMGGNGGAGGAGGGGGGGGGSSATLINSGAGGTGGDAQIKIWVFG
jgi:hypothetical protein